MPARIATPDDADTFAPILRPADATEVLRMGEGPVASVLRRSIARSVEAYVFEDGGHPLAVYGIVQPSAMDPMYGVPWLVGTRYLTARPKQFLRETVAQMAIWRTRYTVMSNMVDARYAQAIRWLRWLGFSIGAPMATGLHGAPFRHIEMRA